MMKTTSCKCVCVRYYWCFYSIKSHFTWYHRPSFTTRNEIREKNVSFFVNQNFSMPVFTFWSVSRAFCWWVEIQNNKNKNMLKNVERQTIYMHMYERLNEFLCVLFCGGNCAGCASFESFFLLQFLLSFTQWKLRTFSFGFFCISFPLRIIHPSIFIPFFIHTPLITWSRLDYHPYGWA